MVAIPVIRGDTDGRPVIEKASAGDAAEASTTRFWWSVQGLNL
jgi:hypothetical protein